MTRDRLLPLAVLAVAAIAFGQTGPDHPEHEGGRMTEVHCANGK